MAILCLQPPRYVHPPSAYYLVETIVVMYLASMIIIWYNNDDLWDYDIQALLHNLLVFLSQRRALRIFEILYCYRLHMRSSTTFQSGTFSLSSSPYYLQWYIIFILIQPQFCFYMGTKIAALCEVMIVKACPAI